MNYNSILELLDNGVEAEQVLAFLKKNSPYFAKKIGKFLTSGLGPWETVGGLSRDPEASRINISKFKPYSPEDIAQITALKNRMSIPEQREQQAKQRILGFLKGGINLAVGLGGGVLAGKALQGIAPKVGNLLAKGGMAALPGQAKPEMVETPIAPGKEEKNRGDLSALKADLNNLKLLGKIERLATSNNPEVLGGMLQKQITPEQKQVLEGKFGKPFGELVKDYANFYLQKAEEKPLSRESLNKQFEEREVSREQIPEEKKEKLVALPNGGIGTLLGEKQGIADIQLPDGEIRRRKLTEVDVEPPELEKQITDLIQAIPEDERSAVLAFASYSPDAEFEMGGKKHSGPFMGVQFHNGDFYMYPDVTKEQFDRVVQKTTKAKTSGENPWHAWTAGKESRGAGMYELIQELRKEFGDNFIKFKASEGYDYFKRIREIVKKIERERKTKKRP